MPLADISNTYVSSAYQPAQAPSSKLDKNGFLKMLTEQLKNQDPSSSQDPSQYFQTISQMTLVEQMTNMAQQSTDQLKATKIASAQALIGRTASYLGADGTPVSGLVTAVNLTGGLPTLTIGDKSGIKPDALTEVK
jgi:flagellar basal-body rod modification protein FlgD